MELDSFDGGDDGEYNGVGYVETSEILATQDAFLFVGNIIIWSVP